MCNESKDRFSYMRATLIGNYINETIKVGNEKESRSEERLQSTKLNG